jgi:hypothetical protein
MSRWNKYVIFDHTILNVILSSPRSYKWCFHYFILTKFRMHFLPLQPQPHVQQFLFFLLTQIFAHLIPLCAKCVLVCIKNVLTRWVRGAVLLIILPQDGIMLTQKACYSERHEVRYALNLSVMLCGTYIGRNAGDRSPTVIVPSMLVEGQTDTVTSAGRHTDIKHIPKHTNQLTKKRRKHESDSKLRFILQRSCHGLWKLWDNETRGWRGWEIKRWKWQMK